MTIGCQTRLLENVPYFDQFVSVFLIVPYRHRHRDYSPQNACPESLNEITTIADLKNEFIPVTYILSVEGSKDTEGIFI
jgi:hypothetical protein